MAASNLSGQIADFAQAVTTSDTASNQYTYLYVGGAGNVSVIPEGSETAVVYSSVPAGQYIFLRVSKVNATGTTATNIVGHR